MIKLSDILFLVLSAIVVFGSAFCKDRYEEYQLSHLAFVPGTYTAAANGYHGKVELGVTFDERNITDIEVLNEQETEDIGHKAIPNVCLSPYRLISQTDF
mgnify:CR=1 FL=1